jgi:hypothetical protein
MAPNQKAVRGVVLLVLLGLVAFVGLWGLGVAVADVGTETAVNETVNQSASWQSVGPDDADRFSAALVTNQSRELERGEYVWNQSDGAIRFNQTAQNGTENVTVETTAVTLPDQGATIVTILEPLTRIPAYAIFFVAAGAVIFGMKGLTKMGSRGRGPV